MKIVSGGQTGADRAALDWAIANAISHGGWCPKGRMAEDGATGNRYQLKETPNANYIQRTEWNVRDSDAKVIFRRRKELQSGKALTAPTDSVILSAIADIQVRARMRAQALPITKGKATVLFLQSVAMTPLWP